MSEMKKHQKWSARMGALALVVGVGAFAGCSGSEDENDQSQVAVCENADECDEGEFCTEEGVCEAGEAENQETVEIEDEDYRVSFWGRSIPGVGDRIALVDLVGSRDGSKENLLMEGFDCTVARDCGVTADASHLIEIEPVPGSNSLFNVYFGVIDASTLIPGMRELWLSEVTNPRIRGNGVIFEKRSEGRFLGYYQEPGGAAQEVAPLGQENDPIGRYWDADPISDRAIVFLPTLESVDIWIGTISEGVGASDQVATLDRQNLPGAAGSFYVGQLPVGFSSDGNLVAVSTVAPNAHGSCVTNDDCSGASQICGSEDRCVAIESTVHIFDMESVNTLGDPCSSHERCGEVHRCDSPSEDFANGVCAPQRVVLGIPHQPSQNGQSGCVATRANGERSYTDVVGPLSFGPEGNLYFVGRRDCVAGTPSGDDTEANVPKTSILSADPTTGEFLEVYGNVNGEDFDEARCYDEIEFATDITDCITVIDGVKISPDGNDLVFRATNPTVTSPANADRIYDIWRVKRNGEDHDWIGDSPSTRIIETFTVHRRQ